MPKRDSHGDGVRGRRWARACACVFQVTSVKERRHACGAGAGCQAPPSPREEIRKALARRGAGRTVARMSAVDGSLILSATTPVALLLATGYALRRRGVVDEPLRHGLMNLVLWCFFPALVLAKVAHNTALKDDAVAIAAPVAGFLSLLVGYGVCRLFARAAGAGEDARRRAFVYTAGNYNYGYLAIPICEAMYGRDSVAVLLLFNTGIELCLWSVGLVLLTGHFTRDAFKRLINPITLAMLAALVMNRTGLADATPDCLFRFADMLGACAIPCGLLLVGMAIPALIQGFRIHSEPRLSAVAILLRNLLIPAVFAAAAFLPGMPDTVARLLVLQAAMPAALLPIVMCQHYGVAPHVSLRVAVSTTIAGVLTLPAWLMASGPLLRWAGHAVVG